MAKFVLVPGGWHGGWAFEAVGQLLAGEGHEVRALTLSGLGDEPARGANLDSHVDEVVQALHELDAPAVLVGHSYAGMVITGAADRAPSRVGALADTMRLRKPAAPPMIRARSNPDGATMLAMFEALLLGIVEVGGVPDVADSLGIAQTTAQAVELLQGGAPGIHFYTLNKSRATRTILTAIRTVWPPARRPA